MGVVKDFVQWLRRELDDDERAARAATAAPWWHNPGKAWLDAEAFEAYDRSKGEEFVGYGESPFSGCVAATGPGSHAQSMADAAHIARWDPKRVLAEVAAKRRVIRLYENAVAAHRAGSISLRNRTQDEAAVDVLGEAVKALALPLADRDGYRAEWRP